MLLSGLTDFKISTLWLVILFICLRTALPLLKTKISNNSKFKDHFPEETSHSQSICENVVFYLFLLLFSPFLYQVHICFFYWLVQVCMRNVRFYGTVQWCGGRTFKLDSWCMQSSGIVVQYLIVSWVVDFPFQR